MKIINIRTSTEKFYKRESNPHSGLLFEVVINTAYQKHNRVLWYSEEDTGWEKIPDNQLSIINETKKRIVKEVSVTEATIMFEDELYERHQEGGSISWFAQDKSDKRLYEFTTDTISKDKFHLLESIYHFLPV